MDDRERLTQMAERMGWQRHQSSSSEWTTTWEDPGERPDIVAALGRFGAIDHFGTVNTSVLVGQEGDGEGDLVGLLMHPELEGVAVAAVQDTPAARLGDALTERLRERGWRWATGEELLALFTGYQLPVTPPPSPPDGAARARALTDATTGR